MKVRKVMFASQDARRTSYGRLSPAKRYRSPPQDSTSRVIEQPLREGPYGQICVNGDYCPKCPKGECNYRDQRQ